ncbi:MAG: hypothetical protein IT424_05545, partial [Pirellulales bacterium]|nr:hypothetical protein [Pirellulales bacterium]
MVLAAGGGCDRTTAPPAVVRPAVVRPAVSKPASAPAALPSEAHAPKPSEAKPSNAKPNEAKPQAAQTAPSPPPAERVLLLTPAGPLLMAVRVTVDGRPLGEGLEELIDQVVAAARSGSDRQASPPASTWAALVANEAFLKSQSPDGREIPQRQRSGWIERFDFNRDGQMQRSEAAAWLGRDSGGPAKSFSLRSSRSFRPDARTTSQIWSLVDADGDGLASSDELHRAPLNLRSLDANDDEMITPAELVSLRDQLAAASSRSSGDSDAARCYAAIHLEPDVDPARLEYLLTELYAPRQDLRPASWGVS